MECLNEIIGLSQKECECFEGDKPANANVSKSGLFLDELPGLELKMIDAAEDCGEGNVWERMLKAVTAAEINTKTEILKMLNNTVRDAYEHFGGFFGKRNFNGSIPASSLKNYQGVNIEAKDIRGSMFVLKEIDAFFDETTTGEITVNIYRSDNPTPLYFFNIDTEANVAKKNILSVPIELPMWVDGFEDVQYHIIYSKHATAKPLNNRVHCNCSDGKNKTKWSQFGYVQGINIDSFTTVQDLDEATNDNYLYGLGLIGELKCEKSTIICDEDRDLDFENDAVALSIAQAIRYNAGVILIHSLIDRPDSTIVALNEEQLVFLANEYSQAFKDEIQFIANNINVDSNDCFVCRNLVGIRGIKS